MNKYLYKILFLELVELSTIDSKQRGKLTSRLHIFLKGNSIFHLSQSGVANDFLENGPKSCLAVA